MAKPWIVVGAGRCGLQLACAMWERGLPLAGVVVRSGRSLRRARRFLPPALVQRLHTLLPQKAHFLLAVQDREIPAAAQALASFPPAVALHTAGSAGPEALQVLTFRGWAVGALHPLFPFPPSPRPAESLRGVPVTFQGDPPAGRAARALARGLQLRFLTLPPVERPLYHAAATLAGPGVFALLQLAREELVRAGFPPRLIRAALEALVIHAVAAAFHKGKWRQLTGPLPRGDRETLVAHLAHLRPEVARVYEALAEAVALRLQQGGLLPPALAQSLRRPLAESAPKG